MDLPGAAALRGDQPGDLPQRHRLALARPLADAQLRGRVREVVLMGPAPVIGAGDGRELLSGKVGGRPLRQVSTSNPAAVMSANRAGHQPPRSKHTVARRSWPTMPRSAGSRRRSSPARESDGSATTMNTGSPPASVAQVSIVAGAGNFSRATWVFCTCRAP